ncbi:hypothetical protein WDJ51_07900 [Rathayibacter sp. YIM 133350]|uniref:hypothetical protein n=1 Tax=Rathayibacter sp. YIM 133350 TaxID=3131992 RepID=UPI00307E47DD
MSREPTRRGSLTLTGVAASRTTRAAAMVGVAGALFALAGCSSLPKDGTVVTGADGEKYVVPDDTERPVYASKEECLADVAEQLEKLRQDGKSVDQTPEQLCESSDRYQGHYGAGLWLGPLLFAGSRWNSSRVSSWAPVQAGGFAAPGSAPSDVAEKAPASAKVGSRAPLTGGFGSSGKSSGFGHSVKSGSGGFGSFGG